MRVNQRVFTERIDMLDGIRVPNCPSQFKAIAENIMNMASKPGYSVPDYNTMTELDKILMLDYWREYDDYNKDVLCGDDLQKDFPKWFIHKATNPELIRRARQWLSQHNYIILKPNVLDNAYEAGAKFSKSITH